jgi:uncharacterized membrane protein
MSDRDLTKGAAVAAAVMGLLLATGCTGTDDEDDAETKAQPVKCLGGNECAGKSECAGGPGSNECKAMNECKGHGWSYEKTAADCTAAGGMVQAS